MRICNILVFISITVTAHSCGSKDDKVIADNYQSCNITAIQGSINNSVCLEAKNSESIKESCEANTGAVYAQTQCTVTTGTKGCSYKNSNLVEFTDWYTGSSWTPDGMASICAGKTGGKVITK